MDTSAELFMACSSPTPQDYQDSLISTYISPSSPLQLLNAHCFTHGFFDENSPDTETLITSPPINSSNGQNWVEGFCYQPEENKMFVELSTPQYFTPNDYCDINPGLSDFLCESSVKVSFPDSCGLNSLLTATREGPELTPSSDPLIGSSYEIQENQETSQSNFYIGYRNGFLHLLQKDCEDSTHTRSTLQRNYCPPLSHVGYENWTMTHPQRRFDSRPSISQFPSAYEHGALSQDQLFSYLSYGCEMMVGPVEDHYMHRALPDVPRGSICDHSQLPNNCFVESLPAHSTMSLNIPSSDFLKQKKIQEARVSNFPLNFNSLSTIMPSNTFWPLGYMDSIKTTSTLKRMGEHENGGPNIEKNYTVGCSCRKSCCHKNYCECYKAHGGCSSRCRCINCKNSYGRNEDSLPLESEGDSQHARDQEIKKMNHK